MYNDDSQAPYQCMRARVQDELLLLQPYTGSTPSGQLLLVNLETGKVSCSNRVEDLTNNYVAVFALIGVLQLRCGAAVAAVTSAERAATVDGKALYKVTGTIVFTAHGRPPRDKQNARLVQLLGQATDPLGAGRGLYFSYFQNLTLSSQRIQASEASEALWSASDPDYWWNAALCKPLTEAGADRFVTPMVLGFVVQFSTSLEAKAGRKETLTLTLIARRSRRRAGTRHWRRGIGRDGGVANFVETEQIVEATSSGDACSFCQTRGSIPLMWSNVPNAKYKPPTDIADVDSMSRGPFKAHVGYMTSRYGGVRAVNLVNQKGNEGRLSDAFAHLTQDLGDPKFALTTFDFHKECGSTKYENLSKLWDQVEPTFREFGMYRTKGELGRVSNRQAGVFRTNCVDCLDRTNVVQAMFARKALQAFLNSLGLLGSEQSLHDAFPKLERQFKIAWADHGDMLSTQYAGTGALKSGFTRTGKRTTDGLVDDGLKSVTRYYLNNFEDGHKQDAYDLITGSYVIDTNSVSGPFHAQCSAAWLMLAAFASLLVSLCLAALAPMSDKLSIVHAGEALVAGIACYGITRALGRRGTCRPQLRFDAVKPWLAEEQHDGAKKLD